VAGSPPRPAAVPGVCRPRAVCGQTGVAPPTFVFFTTCDEVSLFVRAVSSTQLRDRFGFEGTPIKFSSADPSRPGFGRFRTFKRLRPLNF